MTMHAGDIGHLSIITAFATSLLSTVSYAFAQYATPADRRRQWLSNAHTLYILHALALAGAFAVIAYLVFTHQYQYNYTYQHSANDLPWYFLLSCIWEGQEGSFLLWACWNALLGVAIIQSAKHSQPTVMAVFTSVQLFLTSMLVGVYLTEDLRIGSSPFILLREALPGTIFTLDPDFIPADGSGLNPLLQNLWMVIHPPVIFLGFALAGVPFAYAMAALWEKNFRNIDKTPAQWLLATVGVLGIGMVMGAYWAYETLNFGGYWNWDPVENAVFVPWLILLAAVHGILLYRRKQKGLGLTLTLVIGGFLLILYSTFLTRSGILGNASVHAFTDLGLSGQLLLFLGFYTLCAIAALVARRKVLFRAGDEPGILSLDFWMVIGLCLFCLAAFQVLLPTSIPVFNTIISALGFSKQFAPPADQVAFYNQFQLWFAIAFCLAGALAQLFYWRHIASAKALQQIIFIPLVSSLLGASLIIFFQRVHHPVFILAIFSALFVASSSIATLCKVIMQARTPAMGGLLAHIGVGIVLIGLVISGGYQQVISHNLVINAPGSDLPVHTVRENLLISRNIPVTNKGYTFTYQNSLYKLPNGDKVPADGLLTLSRDTRLALRDVQSIDGTYYAAGDTLKVDAENTFYQIAMADASGSHSTLYPRMQNNPSMGYIASPSIRHHLTHDIYTHVTNFPDPEKTEWSDRQAFQLSAGQSTSFKGLGIKLIDLRRIDTAPGLSNETESINLEATVEIADNGKIYEARPILNVNSGGAVRLFPAAVEALGVKTLLTGVDPQSGKHEIALITSQCDWITVKSILFPWVSLVWLGFLVITCGIACSLAYRLSEVRALKDSRKTQVILTDPIRKPSRTKQTKPKYQEL